jgi:hypothetical protein
MVVVVVVVPAPTAPMRSQLPTTVEPAAMGINGVMVIITLEAEVAAAKVLVLLQVQEVQEAVAPALQPAVEQQAQLRAQ